MRFVSRLLIFVYLSILVLQVGMVYADDEVAIAPPPMPTSFQGVAFLSDGSFVPEGLTIILRFADVQSVEVDQYGNIRGLVGDNGKYAPVLAEPSNASYDASDITFYLSRLGIEVQAEESYVLDADSGFPVINRNFILTFPNLPPLPTPTPTPTPISTSTPIPTPVSDASIFSGKITVAGQKVPATAVLVAKIGEYESYPALIEGNEYSNLVVAPGDFSFLGEEINFVLNGVKSDKVTIFESGKVVSDFNLIFEGLPTPTPVPTSTPIPPAIPTVTPVPMPTFTPIPTPIPTPILVPTPIPTLTPVPTPTPIPSPVPSPIPTSTPTQESLDSGGPDIEKPSPTPSPTPVPDGGFCLFSPDRPFSSGVGNLMFLLAPLGMTVGIKQYKRRKK
jgi:hypothetical protein